MVVVSLPSGVLSSKGFPSSKFSSTFLRVVAVTMLHLSPEEMEIIMLIFEHAHMMLHQVSDLDLFSATLQNEFAETLRFFARFLSFYLGFEVFFP